MAVIRIDCDLEGVPAGQWIEGSDEITRKRKRQWFEARDDSESESLALKFISGWHLFNLDGSDAPLPTTTAAFDDLHVRTVGWVFRAITQLIIKAQTLPNAKS